MRHNLNLHPEPFEAIKSGLKDIEMRLYDERRRNIKIGDEIEFTNRETNETLLVDVIDLHKFASFDELYKAFPKSRLGYKPDQKADPSDMEIYYSKDSINRFGVLAIEIKLIDVSAR